MNPNELQLEDWVMFDTCFSDEDADEDFRPAQIQTLDDIELAIGQKTTHGLDVYQPIQLEKFHLEHNHFVERDGDMHRFDESFELSLHRISQTWWQATYRDLEEIEDLPPQQVNLYAVHQLQHFMRHCLIDEEIEINPL